MLIPRLYNCDIRWVHNGFQQGIKQWLETCQHMKFHGL